MHIGPYDEVAGKTNEFSRRIARNLHIILREECGLDQVIDPAGGSNYVEWLTDQVAGKAWGIFQGIEKAGGMIVTLEDGSIQEQIDASYQKKRQNVRSRRDRIVGSNMYPNLKAGRLAGGDEKSSCPVHKESRRKDAPALAGIRSSIEAEMVEQAIVAAEEGATVGQIGEATGIHAGETVHIQQVPQRRAAEEFEALRDASAVYKEQTGSPPTILQLNMGPSRRYRLRADWTTSFFEAGGFRIDGATDFDGVSAAVDALKASSASIAVITSDDATYQDCVEALAKAVKEVKPDVTLLVAGAPGENEKVWRDAGVDDFVHVRVNNYEMNQQLLKGAGVIS
jgi:methylmalonyl-CoA mutase